jgi:hypothetical protein
MKPLKARLKKQQCIQHRKLEYLKAIGKVIEGKAEPDYATLRWEKLKEISK